MNFMEQRNPRRAFLHQSLFALPGLAIWPLHSRAISQEKKNQRFELSLHQYSLRKLFEAGELDLLGYPKFVKTRLGIANIEFAAEFCQELFATPATAEPIRRQAEGQGVSIRALLCADGNALDAATAKDRADALENHLQWAKVAEALGCEFIRVRATTTGDRAQQLGHAVQGIGALCDAMESSSVSVLIENITGFSRDPDWLLEVVEKIGSKRVGLIADFGNFDGDIYAGMKRLLPFTKSVCTKSWEFDSAGNETKIDFARMMKVINESDFRGCIAIEYLGEEPVAGIRQTAELVKRFSQVS